VAEKSLDLSISPPLVRLTSEALLMCRDRVKGKLRLQESLGEGTMTAAKTHTTDDAQIRELIDSWAKAIRAKDINAVMSHLGGGILLFDLAPPLQYRGADAYRNSLQEWFATFQGEVGYEIRELSITAGDVVAFSHSLNRITGKRTNGVETDVWVRATVCYHKVNGAWIVAHEHASVPLYMDGSGRAAVDLKP
jgi:ketosteroid isomerase-like protein